MRKKIGIVLISIFLLSLSFVHAVNAKETAAPRSVETLLATGQIQLDQSGTNAGYVKCFAKIDYNIQARTYKVVSAYIEPHISWWVYPFLTVGSVTTSPEIGQFFKSGSVIKVNFKATEGTSGTVWNYSCKVNY